SRRGREKKIVTRKTDTHNGSGAGKAPRSNQLRTPAPAAQAAAEDKYRVVPVESVSPEGINPRRTFNEEKLAELTESVKKDGVLEPLLVRPLKKPKGRRLYEL